MMVRCGRGETTTSVSWVRRESEHHAACRDGTARENDLEKAVKKRGRAHVAETPPRKLETDTEQEERHAEICDLIDVLV